MTNEKALFCNICADPIEEDKEMKFEAFGKSIRVCQVCYIAYKLKDLEEKIRG